MKYAYLFLLQPLVACQRIEVHAETIPSTGTTTLSTAVVRVSGMEAVRAMITDFPALRNARTFACDLHLKARFLSCGEYYY